MIPDWQANCVYLATLLEERHSKIFHALTDLLRSHGVEVRLIREARDIWVRDFMPVQLDLGQFLLFRYDPSYLKGRYASTKTDQAFVKQLGLGECIESELVVDAGNIVASEKQAIMTDRVFAENDQIEQDDVREKLRSQLEVDQLIIIPADEGDLYGHADGVVRFFDENVVVMNDYSETMPEYGEAVQAELLRHGLTVELLPYSWKSSKSDSAVGNYVNFLRTESVVIVPNYGSKLDEKAMPKFSSLIPKTPIETLECESLAEQEGVLNCVSVCYRKTS